MNFKEYKERKKEHYLQFAKVVKNILENLVVNENYHLQQIQCRAKDPQSLQIKLEGKHFDLHVEFERPCDKDVREKIFYLVLPSEDLTICYRDITSSEVVEISGEKLTEIKQLIKPYNLPELLKKKFSDDEKFKDKLVAFVEDIVQEKGIVNSHKIEEEVFDLAGCRIIFYYNGDVDRLLNSGVINNNFEVNWQKSKSHYPKKDSNSANDYYTAIHFVVKLKKERVILPEYKNFDGLWCEIQVHTVLNHAWSETNHNILYKKPDVKEFGKNILNAIEKKLENVIKKYLIPAGHEFQKIQYDYQNLLKGKILVDIDIIREINASCDNNQLYDILERYKTYVLPNFDDISSKINEIINLVKTGIAISKKFKLLSIATPFGGFAGKTPLDVFKLCLDVLIRIRYVDVKVAFLALLEIFMHSSMEEEKNKVIDAAGEFAGYNLMVLQKVGLYAQSELIFVLDKLDAETFLSCRELVIKICTAILKPVATGASSTYDQITTAAASLSGTEKLADIRNRAIEFLKRLYDPKAAENEKRKIISAFNEATKTPYRGNYSDELFDIIERDSKNIVDFYISILPQEHYEILESIENDIAFLSRRTNEKSPLFQSSKRFRDELNKDEEFVIYKTLVGQAVFPEVEDFLMLDQYRQSKVESYVNSINEGNFENWEKRILRCMSVKSNDLATFSYLNCFFLKQLAETQPDFLLQLIKDHELDVSRFLPITLGALLKSSVKAEVSSLVENWLDQGKYLYECSKSFEHNTGLDLKLLRRIFEKAISLGDAKTITQVAVSAVANYGDKNSSFVKELFLSAVKELTKLKKADWIFGLWFRSECAVILSELDEQGVEVILENLLLVDFIDFHAEEILAPIAKKAADKVIEFFGKRLKLKDEAKDVLSNRYDPIPYEFYKLKQPLSAMLAQAVKIIRSWYNGLYERFIFRGAKLLQMIFPDFPESFARELLSLIHSGEESKLEFVLSVLRNYKIELKTLEIYKLIVKRLSEGNKWLVEIKASLDSTGVVTGEFGIAEAYEQRRQEIAEWLSDDDVKVRSFAKDYIADLDKMIAEERRRVEGGIELRKHCYGVRVSEDG